MNAGGLEGASLDLFGQRHGARGGAAGGLLVVGVVAIGGREPARAGDGNARPGLDDIAIERGVTLVPPGREHREPPTFFHDGDCLAGELPRGHALPRSVL